MNAQNIPKKVIYRMRLGKDVAARMKPTQPNCYAWVYIWPIVKVLRLYDDYGGRVDYPQHPTDIEPIGFFIRYVESLEEVVFKAQNYDTDTTGEDGITFDKRYIAGSESSLCSILLKLGVNLEGLKIPHDVGYWPFSPGSELMGDEAKQCWKQ